jgi:hypothetical protein
MEFGSVKDKRVHSSLIEERKRLDFDQEELAILLIKSKEAWEIRKWCNDFCENDPVMKNRP